MSKPQFRLQNDAKKFLWEGFVLWVYLEYLGRKSFLKAQPHVTLRMSAQELMFADQSLTRHSL